MRTEKKLRRCALLLEMIAKKTSYIRDCEVRIVNERAKDKMHSFLLISEGFLLCQISKTECQIKWLKDRFNKTLETINKF